MCLQETCELLIRPVVSFVKDSAMAPVDKLYDIVITSNSGYPLDLNIYQTVKGMERSCTDI